LPRTTPTKPLLRLTLLQDSGTATLPLGRLLVGFLHYFGTAFDAQRQIVSIRVHDATREGDGRSVDPLIIEDPFDATKNVGRNCFRIAQVQSAFREAFEKLLAMAQSGELDGAAAAAAAAAAATVHDERDVPSGGEGCALLMRALR